LKEIEVELEETKRLMEKEGQKSSKVNNSDVYSILEGIDSSP
jgi:hypothetical protein